MGGLLCASLRRECRSARREVVDLVAQLTASVWIVQLGAPLLIALLVTITPGVVRWIER